MVCVLTTFKSITTDAWRTGGERNLGGPLFCIGSEHHFLLRSKWSV